MKDCCHNGYIIVKIFVAVLILAGCTDSAIRRAEQVFIQVGNRFITAKEFRQAFEIAKIAYPQSALGNHDILNEAMLRLLNQLRDELVILKRAEELNLTVTDSELEAAIRDIKSDYPDDTFNQVLLEHAIPYSVWERRLGTRLLKEKVVSEDLEDRVDVTPDDITAFFNEQKKISESDINRPAEADPETVIRKIRRKKALDAYKSWITELRNKYPIYVNNALWEKIKQS